MTTLKNALKRHPNLPKWICHIRQRIVEKRLSLLTGAGVSREVGAPTWTELVENLSSTIPDFADTYARYKEAETADPLITQYIYSRYIDQAVSALHQVEEQFQQQTARIQWHNTIRSVIYKNVPPTVDGIMEKHPYITALGRLCVRCESTITFNFDNILDQVALKLTPQETQPPKTTWNMPPIDKVNFPYIYHINGLLPQSERMKTSSRLVFTEDSFLQVLYASPSANSNLVSTFTNNTFLLVGLSLADHSLKSILAANAIRSPGSIHYIIHWISSEEELYSEQQKDITRFNFDSYGLVTIFLTSDQIRDFLDLVQTGIEARPGSKDGALDEDFRDAIRPLGASGTICFKYYIVGPVASGKSTLLENLRTFRTIEEWPEATIPQLYQDHKDLRPEEREQVDHWIFRQLRIKNRYFARAEPGIHIMDRAPLDLFAFSLSTDENPRKAREVIEQVESVQQLADGEIILLETAPDELLDRQLPRSYPWTRGGVAYDAGGLLEQFDILKETYPGAKVFRTDHCTPRCLPNGCWRT